jgi:catechol 2,3-dioxygenase-like lactoylglutathione lyase family enzyme
MNCLPITQVHHLARVTRRPEESTAFYRDVLGFRELERPRFDFRGAWLFNYGLQIHLIENDDRAPQQQEQIDTRYDHLALHVTDIERAKSILGEHGIRYREQVNAGGIHQVFFHDPDGHIVEIAVYPPTPPEKADER